MKEWNDVEIKRICDALGGYPDVNDAGIFYELIKAAHRLCAAEYKESAKLLRAALRKLKRQGKI